MGLSGCGVAGLHFFDCPRNSFGLHLPQDDDYPQDETAIAVEYE
jgi:hypothetical protein